MARPKATQPTEDFPERLSSGVTVIVRAAPDVYDTLDISRVGGVVTVALPGATPRSVRFAPVAQVGAGEYVPPPITDLADRRAALEAQFADGPLGPAAVARAVVSPASYGLPVDPLGLNSAAGDGLGFEGLSNEDTDA